MLSPNLPSSPKHRRPLQKSMPFSEGNQLFADDFQKMNFIFWMKQMLVCFNLQSNGTGTGS